MKILRVIASMDPRYGGPCQGIRNSIPEMECLGSKNTVLSIDDPLYNWEATDSFQVIKMGPSLGPWGYSKKLIPWLRTHLSNFDVVIVHGIWQYYGFAVRKVIKEFKKKNRDCPRYFIMPHGMLDPYFQEAPERKWKALRNSIVWNLVERNTINEADGLLFTCEEELVLAQRTFSGYMPKKTINVGYGIPEPPLPSQEDIKSFKQECGLNEHEDYLLFLSRLHRKKGLLHLLNGYATFENNSDQLPKLIIAGPGLETEFGKTLTGMINQNDFLKENVIFSGMVSGGKKWAAFYGANSFILPSHQENFGIAVVEALSCKCPVLISNKVNIWREIEDGGGGVVSTDTLDGVVELIACYKNFSKESLLAKRENAFNVYMQNFTVSRAAQRLLKALR